MYKINYNNLIIFKINNVNKENVYLQITVCRVKGRDIKRNK